MHRGIITCSPNTQANRSNYPQTQVELNVLNPFNPRVPRAHAHWRFVEQRRAVRFQLRVPVIFRWGRQTSVGQTRDIGITGVFITCPTLPPVGTALSLEIHIPPLERNTSQLLYLEATGRVIRVAAGEESRGFAATAPFALREVMPVHLGVNSH
jgi:hypothetical protein